jgi:hypothetical protein
MAQRKQTKAERRQAQATAGEQASPGRKQGKGRKREARAVTPPAEPTAAPTDAVPEEGIEARLARIEEAVAAQSELSEELLGKLDDVLAEARKSARLGKAAATRSDGEGD